MKQRRPTQKQITAEIAKLTKMKPKVLRRSGFGDDHHEAIDAQIDVLKKGMDLDEVYENYESRDLSGAEEDCAQNVYEAAVEACHWMTNENKEPAPSKGWAELVR